MGARLINGLGKALAVGLTVGLWSCGAKMSDAVSAEQSRIESGLRSQGIFERGNVPEGTNPDQIKGHYDILPGEIYRHVVNENRAARGECLEIKEGDTIEFMYDARVFTSGSYENQNTFRTNIADRIKALYGSNPDFTGEGWPTDPMKIVVGNDASILKPLQQALISCRAGDGDPSNDEQEDGLASDRVRVWLTSDMAFGNRWVYLVPPGSTIVYEVTDIEIIR